MISKLVNILPWVFLLGSAGFNYFFMFGLAIICCLCFIASIIFQFETFKAANR